MTDKDLFVSGKQFTARCLCILIFSLLCFTSVAQTGDSTRRIQIIGANSFRQIVIDSGNTLQTLAGNARVKQGNTILSGDSIAINLTTGVTEVFGNVHINDADTLNTYSQYLRYVGTQRIAYLKKNVKLTDGKATLTTEELEYNLNTGIAEYKNGGRVVNGSTILTSRDAVYYSDTKDVYFKRSVKLTDPKYNITSDSLLYNTAFRTATFIAPTHIVTKDGVVDTESGTYNMQTGEAIFTGRPVFRDSTHSLTGRNVAYHEESNTVQVEGNGKLVDSVNKVILLGDQILLDRNNSSFLGTRKPVMIIYRDNDSTYLTADTLFSGLRLHDSSTRYKAITDTTINSASKVPPDSIRYFLGFHHVRIYNDSMQAVSDSLYYSTEDSVFRMFKDPVFWNGKTQVTGDTMYLFTKNQRPERLEVFNKSMVISDAANGLYNQVAGRTLFAYFKDGQIDYCRQRGTPAESIFYPIEEDSSYVGMNRSSGDVIDIYFVNKELNKVKFVNNVNGTLYPIKQIPAGKKELPGFKWLDNRRPKNKLELFE